MNDARVRVDLDFDAAPTDFPEGCGRAQDRLGIAFIFVQALADNFSGLAAKKSTITLLNEMTGRSPRTT